MAAKQKPAGQKELSAWQLWRDSKGALDELCSRIEDGESMRAICVDIGTPERTMRDWINADAPRSARVREARRRSSAACDDLALERIRGATDPFDLAKAKEEAHHLRWRASKINPREYGDRTTLAGDPESPLAGPAVFAMTNEQLLAIAAGRGG